MENLSAGKVIERVYEGIFPRSSENLKLSRSVAAKIGDDSDWHKTREFFMDYTKAKKVSLSEKEWILAYGTMGENHLTNAANAILAFPKDGWRKRNEFLGRKDFAHEPESIEEKIELEGHYFSSVILASSAEGAIALPEDTKVERWRLRDRLNSKLVRLRDFVKAEPRVDRGHIAVSTMRPVLHQGALYSPEAVDYLVPVMQELLLDMAKINKG